MVTLKSSNTNYST